MNPVGVTTFGTQIIDIRWFAFLFAVFCTTHAQPKFIGANSTRTQKHRHFVADWHEKGGSATNKAVFVADWRKNEKKQKIRIKR